MQDDRLVVAERADTSLSREQKAGLFFVVVCGLGALIFGVQYVWTHMAKPFSIEYTGPRLVTGAEKQSAEIAQQKSSDTDSDAVSDYDELYIFKTSPYLADSDSDGLSDGDEITAGQDPNCAAGATCESASIDGVNSETADFLEEDAAAAQAEAQRLQASLDTLRNIPPDEIRLLLINAGGTEEEISAMSDEEVKDLYDQLITDLQQSGALQNLANQILGPDAASASPTP